MKGCKMNAKNGVGGGLTVVGFDREPDDILAEMQKNAENDIISELEAQEKSLDDMTEVEWDRRVRAQLLSEPYTDVDLVTRRDPGAWTAPKQDLVGGALFFFLSAKAWINARYCYNNAKKHPTFQRYPVLMAALQRNYDYIKTNHRHLIGVARVVGRASYGNSLGFRTTTFAETEDFHLLDTPISYDEVQEITIINAATNYSLVGRKSDQMRELAAKYNTLPEWLTKMTFGESVYADMNRRNWLEKISTLTLYIDAEHTASPEQVIRAYFIDFFIEELLTQQDNQRHRVDQTDTIFTEVTTYRDKKATGRADYMLNLFGHWIPFEAKVGIATEKDILSQVKQYTHVDYFIRGGQKYPVGQHGYCLLGDQYGVYLCKDGQWVDCAADRPLWARTSLNRKTMREIQEYLGMKLRAF
jgi:hypothetical protein